MCSQIKYHKDRTIAAGEQQNNVAPNVPSIPEIQQTLVNVGDKSSKFMNSKEWIGAVEVRDSNSI